MELPFHASESTFEDFEFIKSLGNGSYGDVKLYRHLHSQQKVVIKRIPLTNGDALIRKEIEAGLRLRHKYIVPYYGDFRSQRYAFLILGYVKGENLYSFLSKRDFKPMKERHSKSLFRQLLESVQFSHQQEVSHGDIKMENVMISKKGRVTLIDFGFSRVEDGTLSEQWMGSMDYVAPEILLRTPFEAKKADVWSLGVILYILLTGELPFARGPRIESLRHGTHPTIDWPASSDSSFSARKLVQSMLDPNPTTRISVDECLKYDWMRSGITSFFSSPMLSRKNTSEVVSFNETVSSSS